MKYLLVLMLFVCGTAYAENKPWTDTEKKLFVANTILTMADWSQTRQLPDHPELRELNPILGPHPSKQTIDLFFAAQLIGSYYLFDHLGSNRKNVMITFTVVRAAVVGHNASLGVKVAF